MVVVRPVLALHSTSARISASSCGKLVCLLPKPTNRLARKIDPDALDLRIEFERVLAHLTAIARLLVSAKWRGGIEHVVGIDPDDAGLHSFSKAVRACDVARPDAGG